MKTSYLFIRFFSTEFLHLPNVSLFHHWDEAAWLKLDKKKKKVESLVNQEKPSRASLELWKLLFTDDNQQPPPHPMDLIGLCGRRYLVFRLTQYVKNRAIVQKLHCFYLAMHDQQSIKIRRAKSLECYTIWILCSRN